MAIVRPIEDTEGWAKWVAERPACVQELIAKLPPDRLYRLHGSGHRVTIYSYCEDGTVSVTVSGEFNFVVFERNVFGVKPEDLTECDLPSPEELTGAMTDDEAAIEAICDEQRRRTSHERN